MAEWVMGGNLVALVNNQTRELVATSDVLDQYDVRSFNTNNVIEWRLLRSQYVEEALELIDLIVANEAEIRKQLSESLRDH